MHEQLANDLVVTLKAAGVDARASGVGVHLFVSGQVDDSVDGAAMNGEGSAFLPKPYTADELLEQVRLLLEVPLRRSAQ